MKNKEFVGGELGLTHQIGNDSRELHFVSLFTPQRCENCRKKRGARGFPVASVYAPGERKSEAGKSHTLR